MNILNIKKEWIVCCFILLCSLRGWKIIYDQGGNFRRPTLRENTEVLLNQIQMDYAIKKHYPEIPAILEAARNNEEKFAKAAWGIGTEVNFPAFLLPNKPMVSLWFSANIIKWDSYASEELIVKDLKDYGIEWIMKINSNGLSFVPVEGYAMEAVKFERHPKTIYYGYDFPLELSEVRY